MDAAPVAVAIADVALGRTLNYVIDDPVANSLFEVVPQQFATGEPAAVLRLKQGVVPPTDQNFHFTVEVHVGGRVSDRYSLSINLIGEAFLKSFLDERLADAGLEIEPLSRDLAGDRLRAIAGDGRIALVGGETLESSIAEYQRLAKTIDVASPDFFFK